MTIKGIASRFDGPADFQAAATLKSIRRAAENGVALKTLPGEFAAELERVSRLGLPREDAPATAK